MDTKEGTALVEADHTEQLSKGDQYFKDYQNSLVGQLRPPLRHIRAIALLQQLRKNGTLHNEAAWRKAANDIGLALPKLSALLTTSLTAVLLN